MFAAKMWVAFALQKLLTFFQQKNINVRVFAIFQDRNFNISLANNFVLFWRTGLWTFANKVYPKDIFKLDGIGNSR